MQAFVWPFIAGLPLAALIVLIAINVLNTSAKKSRDAFARAVPAVARVLRVGKATTSRSYRGVVIDLLIQVHVSGTEPYELNTMWAVDTPDVAKTQVGQTFAIKVDPQDHNKIYSDETWAR